MHTPWDLKQKPPWPTMRKAWTAYKTLSHFFLALNASSACPETSPGAAVSNKNPGRSPALHPHLKIVFSSVPLHFLTDPSHKIANSYIFNNRSLVQAWSPNSLFIVSTPCTPFTAQTMHRNLGMNRHSFAHSPTSLESAVMHTALS